MAAALCCSAPRRVARRARPGTPRKFGGDPIAKTVRRTLENTSPGATHWSLHSMAKAVGRAPSTIHRIWTAFGLQPHRNETFKFSTDPLFVEKVRDIVSLSLDPPDRALMLCVDEKLQIQVLDQTQSLLPMRPGPVGLKCAATGLDEAPKICATMGVISSGLHGSMRAVVTAC